MIYFDNGATSLVKPKSVSRAVQRALKICANPGRGGHKPSMRAAETVFLCREEVAGLFGLADSSRVMFTLNCTHALNIAIKGILKNGGHAVVSGYEHNSVVRPLEAMKGSRVTYTIARSPLFDRAACVRAISAAITEETRCVIVTCVSNVFGFVLPIEEIDKLCAEKGVLLILDAAQAAGSVPIDVKDFSALAYICMPGHKGLLGPQGTGILISVKDNLAIDALMEGGTGSNSAELQMPEFLPDRHESGTVNVPGIAGLAEGIRYVRNRGLQEIRAHEAEILHVLNEGLSKLPGVEVFYPDDPENISGVISFRTPMQSDELAGRLGDMDICVRAGLHCAPTAHQTAGTMDTGTVRVGLSPFSTLREAARFIEAARSILSKDA